MPAEAIGSAIEDLAEKDFDKSQCRAIVKKVRNLSLLSIFFIFFNSRLSTLASV